jgi:4'-phosphopantetheinyl transferase
MPMMRTEPGRVEALLEPLALPAWPRAGDVHVWTIDLRAPPAASTQCLDRLEVERVRRFVHADDARRYQRAHVALRAIVGAYLGCEPTRVAFVQEAQGKPRLIGPCAGLYFNLSHSKDLAMLALGVSDELGVDVEAVRADLPGPDLAAAVLDARELEQLARLPESEQAEPFVTCWTRKEACLKAVGLGLNLEPRTLHAGLEPRPLRVCVGARDLELVSLGVRPGYAAALAVVGGIGKVLRFELDGRGMAPG